MIEFQPGDLASILAIGGGLLTGAVALGRIAQRVTEQGEDIAKISEALLEHLKEDADRLARIETELKMNRDT